MNTSGEAAEQLVRMSLNGVEVIAKITGKGSLKLASVLYKELKSNKHSKGKQRLETMLRSGKQLKVIGISDASLATFAKEAKKYGFPFCVLKDRDATDGITDIMVGVDDVGKVSRIFERFKITQVEQSTIDTEMERSKKKGSEIPVPETDPPVKESKEESFVEELMKKPTPNHEQNQTANPMVGRATKSRQSEPSLKTNGDELDRGTLDDPKKRPSVRKELKEIKDNMEKKSTSKTKKSPRRTNTHKQPKVKNKDKKER